jgi:putative addiction module component (TIGR02574 family)
MSLPLHVVTTEAMALDPADRLRLAKELLDSVEEPAGAGWGQAWSAVLDRRVAEAERTGDRGRPWDEVRAELLNDLARR